MKQEVLQSSHGYAIPYRSSWEGQDQVLIACHGFGSSKASPMIQALEREMPKHGIGVYSFDFPAHGDSPVWQEGLRVPFCIDDLATVENHVRTRLPRGEIGYFGSSFGAYITLLYLALRPHKGTKAFLRSSAVSMPKLVWSWVDQKAKNDLDRQGYFVPDYDYVREMRITQAFLQDLVDYDVFDRYQTGEAELCMIHGARDSLAPVEDARRFAHTFGSRLVELPQGEHDLMGEGELEQVLAAAAAFFRQA